MPTLKSFMAIDPERADSPGQRAWQDSCLPSASAGAAARCLARGARLALANTMRNARTAAATLVLVLWTVSAGAFPMLGERFPSMRAQDLTGQQHSTDELFGRRTMVVAIADRDGADAMRAWFFASRDRVPASVSRESLISLHLPFFISTSYARGKAREQVPEQFWRATLLDRGGMAKQLGLDGEVPYVFALDENGRIMAVVHDTVDSRAAQNIWRALAQSGL
jgi:hypothetical protein